MENGCSEIFTSVFQTIGSGECAAEGRDGSAIQHAPEIGSRLVDSGDASQEGIAGDRLTIYVGIFGISKRKLSIFPNGEMHHLVICGAP